MRVEARTEVGLVRDHNEDQYLADEQRRIFVVADGLGGHAAGEIASHVAVRALHDAVSTNPLDQHSEPAAGLLDALTAAHDAVLENASRHPSRSGMGTTAVVAYLSADERELWVGHAGDSRAYLCRGRDLRRLTADHRSGLGLSQALGIATISPDIARIDLEPGDRLLLCSDGLTDLVDDDTIAEALAADEPLDERADRLVREAMSRGGLDNVTVLLVDVGA